MLAALVFVAIVFGVIVGRMTDVAIAPPRRRKPTAPRSPEDPPLE